MKNLFKYLTIFFFLYPFVALSSSNILELSAQRDGRKLTIDFEKRIFKYVVYKNVTNEKSVKRTLNFNEKGQCNFFDINLKVEVNPDVSRLYWRVWPHYEKLDPKLFNGIEKSNRFILTFKADYLFDSLINKNLINIEEAYNKGSNGNKVFLGFLYKCKDFSMFNKASFGTRFRLYKNDREKLLKYADLSSIRYEKEKKLVEAKQKKKNEKAEQEKRLAKLEQEKKIEAERKKKEKLAIEKAKQEKQRQAELEREKRLKAEQERIKKKAAEAERKKKLEEEKRRKKKLAEEKARKKKLAEQELKRKLAQDKLKKQIANYKRRAKNFYKDIEDFVKEGGDIDLVLLSDFFDVKPNPQNKWNTSDLSNYKNLREFMTSIPQFVSFEKERIGERLKSSFAMKDQSIAQLEKNLSDLKGLMRKMFGSSEVPKIKSMIKDIQSTLSTFNQTAANNILNKSSTYIASKLPKAKSSKQIKKVVSTSDTNWSTVKNDLTIQQQQFCQLTDRFYDNIDKARKSKNEIKVNMVHKERQENLDALIPQGNISNWIFKVIKIDQVEDGSAAVVLGLQCRSYVGSGQTIDVKKGMSSKDKKQWRATIPYNDRRFRELAKLDQGQFIVGSGTMLEINAYKPGQKETFYASQQIGEHPLTKGLNLEGELFIADLSYIAALN